MSKRVVFLEIEGGSDKGPDGHRRDTMPMIEALGRLGWHGEAAFYHPDRADELAAHIAGAAAYVSRVNPGNIPGGEPRYQAFLRGLSAAGVKGMPHPDVMQGFGAKDALVKLRDTTMVPDDTYAFYSVAEIAEGLPRTLALGERVLKQNRGSTGEGIWRVQLDDPAAVVDGRVPGDARVRCTEAVDNHVEHHTLDAFVARCEQYVVGEGGMLVDMPFLPRIREGELRILLVGPTPVFVVVKRPADHADAFSATLFSGAKYTYEDVDAWRGLVDPFIAALPKVQQRFGVDELPLLWTADFILDDAPDGGDAYVLGEMNCSCVGFTSHLDIGIQDTVARRIVETAS